MAQGYVAPHLLAQRVRPRGWKPRRHQSFISWRIATTVPHGDARLIFNLGPRWGKSELLCVDTPVWFLENYPTLNVMMATATTPLADQWGGRVRDTFAQHPWLATKLKEDSKAKDTWHTTAGGGMKCVGVGKATLGFGADLLIIDDPYPTWKEGQSAHYRRNIEEWITGTMESRLNPKGSVVMLHHRMHPRDATGYLLAQPDAAKWQHYSLPSLATSPDDPMGRAIGEPLDESTWSAFELEKKRLAMQWAWEPMHQQNPQALGNGAIYHHFHERNLEPVELRPGEPVHLAIDFNINPGMHLVIGQHRTLDNLFTFTHEIHGPRMHLKMAVEEFVRLWRGLSWRPDVWLTGDPAGNAADIKDGESNWQAVRILLGQAGIRVRTCVAAKAPGVLDSVRLVNEALKSSIDGRVSVKINPRCSRLVTDLREVVGDEEGKPEKSQTDLTHASDCVRYMIHYHSPGYSMQPRVHRGTARVMV